MKSIFQQDLKYLTATIEFGEADDSGILELAYEGNSISMDAEEWEMLLEFVATHWNPQILISQEYEIAKRKGNE